MTRARAIELLKGIQFCCDLDDCTNAWDCEECDDALNMAIQALEQEPKCEDCKWNTWDNNCMVEYRGCRFEPNRESDAQRQKQTRKKQRC